jgi:hypothetical protein
MLPIPMGNPTGRRRHHFAIDLGSEARGWPGSQSVAGKAGNPVDIMRAPKAPARLFRWDRCRAPSVKYAQTQIDNGLLQR